LSERRLREELGEVGTRPSKLYYLVSYLILMYVSVFPVAMSIRRTNAYEERSLRVYNSEKNEDASLLSTPILMKLG
jgi:Trk-type K+ transport system membrane component